MDTPNIDLCVRPSATPDVTTRMKAHLELEGLKLKLQDNGLSVKLDRIQERIDNLVALREHAIKCGGSLYEAARCQSDIEVLLWVQRVFACV